MKKYEFIFTFPQILKTGNTKKLLLSGLAIIITTLQVTAQNIDCVDDVRYTTHETKILLLPKNTTFGDIHVYDIPSLKHTEKTKTHHEFIDSSGEIQHEIVLTNALNSHEEWEVLANKWIINQYGLTSYNTLKGGTQINQIPYNSITTILYNLHKQTVSNEGLLLNKAFPINITNELINSNIPFVIFAPGIILTSDSTTYTIFNENSPKTITKITYKTGGPNLGTLPNTNDTEVINTDISVYDIELCNEYLLSTKVRMRKDTLSNGLCSKQIVTTEYSSYEFTCCGAQAMFTGNKEHTILNLDFTIYPNPLNSNTFTITLPDPFVGESINLSIHTLEGKLIQQFPAILGSKRQSLHVNRYLKNQGLYLMRVVNKNKVLSKKFFFVN